MLPADVRQAKPTPTVSVAFDAASAFPTTQKGLSGPTTAPTATAFGAQLGNTSAALASGYSKWNPTGSIGVTDSRESARVGQQRNAPLGTGPAALLSAHAEPNAPVISNGLDVTHIADTAELANSKIPGPMRFVTAGEAYELPGAHQFSFIKKNHAATARALLPGPGVPDGHRLSSMFNPGMVAAGRGPQAMATGDMSMQIGQHVYALNSLICREQQALFNNDIIAYSKLRPSDILLGHPDLPWTGWDIDGIVELEKMADGGSSKFNDGYMTNSVRNMLKNSAAGARPSNMSKTLTTTRAGRARIVDVFGGRGIKVGSSQWLICTKKPLTTYGHRMTYTLSTKAGPFTSSGGSGVIQYTQPIEDLKDSKQRKGVNKDATIRAQEAALYDALTMPFTPFQLFFLSVPDGGNPPSCFKEWTDEWGHTHYDAHYCPLSRLIFEPYQYEARPPITRPSDPAFMPAMDGTESLTRMLIEGVLLHPCKDGARDVFI